MVALVITQIVIQHLISHPVSPHSDELNAWFGTLTRSCITLYEAITGGLDWDDLLRPLMSDISPAMFVILASHIAFSLFAVLNVVTGVFVDTACGNAARDKDEFLVNHISDVYKNDLDDEGCIALKEFVHQLDTPEMQHWLRDVDVDK